MTDMQLAYNIVKEAISKPSVKVPVDVAKFNGLLKMEVIIYLQEVANTLGVGKYIDIAYLGRFTVTYIRED